MEKTICQQLNLKVEPNKPFRIINEFGKGIYYENWEGLWSKLEYDERGNEIFYKKSDGYWVKSKYDQNNNRIYLEDVYGNVEKCEWEGNKLVYKEVKEMVILDVRKAKALKYLSIIGIPSDITIGYREPNNMLKPNQEIPSKEANYKTIELGELLTNFSKHK